MTDVSQTPGAIPLQDIFITDELDRRPRRPPDYQAENQGLVALAQAPESSFQWSSPPVPVTWVRQQTRHSDGIGAQISVRYSFPVRPT
jgi:hypothetical protein